jgi:hypothetical protein
VGRNQITRLLSFLLDDDHRHQAKAFNETDKFGDLYRLAFAVKKERNFSISRGFRIQFGNFCPFLMDPNHRIGFQLRDHMVAQLPTGFNQLFGPIPTVDQKIKLARRRQTETLKHPLGQSDFGPEATASFGPLCGKGRRISPLW